jgi:tRNA (cmo5U34)-methyltransferase
MNRFGNNSEEEWSNVEHALAYINKADNIPHRTEGEAVLLDYVPKGAGGGY